MVSAVSLNKPEYFFLKNAFYFFLFLYFYYFLLKTFAIRKRIDVDVLCGYLSLHDFTRTRILLMIAMKYFRLIDGFGYTGGERVVGS